MDVEVATYSLGFRRDLANCQPSHEDMKRPYNMDSSTKLLFKRNFAWSMSNPQERRKKGGVKAHTIIKVSENVPCHIRYNEAVQHNYMYFRRSA